MAMAENSSQPQVQVARQRASALIPLSLICVLGTLWGASASLAKLPVFDGIQPLCYALWNSAGAGAIMLAICAWRGMLPRVKVEHIRYYAICGVLGVAVPNLNVVVVVGHIPAGVVAVALSTTPIMTYAIALVWRLERFDAIRASGLLLALVGTLFIILPKASLPTPGAAPRFSPIFCFLRYCGWSAQSNFLLRHMSLPLPESGGVSCCFPRPIALGFGWQSHLSLLDWRWSR